MKGLSGKQTRGLPSAAKLVCADNSGAKVLKIIGVMNYKGVARRYPSAGVGDVVVASVKVGNPEMKHKVVHAVIIRQRRPFRRPDGTTVRFEDNAAVVINDNGDMKGSDIKGCVAREAAERWPRIAATASTIV